MNGPAANGVKEDKKEEKKDAEKKEVEKKEGEKKDIEKKEGVKKETEKEKPKAVDGDKSSDKAASTEKTDNATEPRGPPKRSMSLYIKGIPDPTSEDEIKGLFPNPSKVSGFPSG